MALLLCGCPSHTIMNPENAKASADSVAALRDVPSRRT
jgi:hypothetical protein